MQPFRFIIIVRGSLGSNLFMWILNCFGLICPHIYVLFIFSDGVDEECQVTLESSTIFNIL